jgi:hypothetical protein
VGNGLGSPLCRRAAGAGGLSSEALRNCRTSGFLVAPAPTSNYAFDVNVEHGLLEVNAMMLLQDYVLAPVWMALVWVVHALLVMLEWCYSLDLLSGGSTMGQVRRGLRQAQATFTDPWLVSVLAVASVLTAYHGLVRRQVSQSIGQALLTLAMMAAGLWMIANPAGTVGALGEWANQASLGTLGAVAEGAPTAGERPLSEGMGAVFAYGIEAPWCYMEFGDVRWCRDPARLDPRLRAAVAHLLNPPKGAKTNCRTGESDLGLCTSLGLEQAHSASGRGREELLDANTNGELFLALPANGTLRNSVSNSESLLRVLCGSSSIESCKGPTAAQAEFRSAAATWQRAAGLMLIVVGTSGMVLALGFIALHLLGAALMSLLYLLLAPAAVLAPAFGEGGRAVFRGWATRLLATVVSKLLFSLLLGTLLLMMRILLGLQGLGWWTQWLLISAVWWGAFRQRHQALGFARGERRPAGAPGGGPHGVRLLKKALPVSRSVSTRGAGWVRGRLSGPGPSVEQAQARSEALRLRARGEAQEQVRKMLEYEHGHARAQMRAAPALTAGLAAMQSRLARIQSEQGRAQQDGEGRRAALLGVRAQRIEAEISQQREALAAARERVGEGERARRSSGEVSTAANREERSNFLDAQAALPAAAELARMRVCASAQAANGAVPLGGAGVAGARAGAPGAGGRTAPLAPESESGRGGAGQRRDYAALASLVGLASAEYQQLDPRRRREARVQIDRELALRREFAGAAEQLSGEGAASLGPREERRVGRDFERTVQRRVKESGSELPASRQPRPAPGDSRDGQAPSRADWLAAGSSPVMRDIHEVAQRRKRQLGRPRR